MGNEQSDHKTETEQEKLVDNRDRNVYAELYSNVNQIECMANPFIAKGHELFTGIRGVGDTPDEALEILKKRCKLYGYYDIIRLPGEPKRYYCGTFLGKEYFRKTPSGIKFITDVKYYNTVFQDLDEHGKNVAYVYFNGYREYKK